MAFFKEVKKGLLVISIVLIIIGYQLIVNGVGSLDFVLSLLAYGLIISGLFNAVRYFLLKDEIRQKSTDFVYGLMFLALGIIVFFTKEQLRGVSIIAFAILIVTSGIMKIQNYLDTKNIGVKTFGINITLLIISLAFGALIIINPFNEKTLYAVTGAGLIYTGIASFVSNISLAILQVRYQKLIAKGIDPTAKKDDYPEGKFTRIDVEDVKREEPLK